MRFNLRLLLNPLWAVLFCSYAAAHEDIDIGIEGVRLDKQCYAHLQLVNAGRDIPESFYRTVNPAFFEINKGDMHEQGRSLRVLDKKKKLQKSGGRLEIRSRKKFARIPAPIKVNLHFLGEFLDYGAANDLLHESMDCIPGRGQIEGEKIIPTAPDITVTQARIDPADCQLQLSFTNLTGIALPDSSWQDQGGTQVMIMALDTHERLADIPLIELDPQRQFTRSAPTLNWQSPLPDRVSTRWRVGLWYVPGDSDFSNNQIDLTTPEACREKSE